MEAVLQHRGLSAAPSAQVAKVWDFRAELQRRP